MFTKIIPNVVGNIQAVNNLRESQDKDKFFNNETKLKLTSNLGGGIFRINFKGNEVVDFTNELKNLENIHCPICGVKMLSQKSIQSLVTEGNRIVSAKSFVNWLERNEECIPEKYKKFVESAKRNSQEFNTRDVETLLSKMRENSYIFTQNALDDVKQTLVEMGEKYEVSDADKVLLDECFVLIDEINPAREKNVFHSVKQIVQETVLSMENEHVQEIYKTVMNKFVPAAQYQQLFVDSSADHKNIAYRQQVLQKLFSGSYMCVDNIINGYSDEKDGRINTILVCKDCKPPTVTHLFRYHKERANLQENFTKYVEDVSSNILDGKMKNAAFYPVSLLGLVSRITGDNISVSKYSTPILKEISKKHFDEMKADINFDIVNHRGVPCASCGEITITHEQKLKLYDDISKTSTTEELSDFLKKNKNVINSRYASIVNYINNAVQSNKNITENEIISHLKEMAAEEIKKHLIENLRMAQVLKSGLKPKDAVLLQQYIDNVNNQFLDVSTKREFPYRAYSDLVKQTIFAVEDMGFRTRHGSDFKESMRKSYVKQTILFPLKSTEEKVGSPLKVIVQDMIKGSIATVDHIVAKDRKGWNNMANYAVMCKNCNNEKTNYSLLHWYDLHHSVAKNMQKYLNKVVDMIQKGELPDEYEKYPYVFARCVNTLTNGRIILRFRLNEKK